MHIHMILLAALAALILSAATADAADYVVRDRNGRVVGTLDDKRRSDGFIVRDRYGRTVGVARPTERSDGDRWRSDRRRAERWDESRRRRDFERSGSHPRFFSDSKPDFFYSDRNSFATERRGGRGFNPGSAQPGGGVYVAPGLRR